MINPRLLREVTADIGGTSTNIFGALSSQMTGE